MRMITRTGYGLSLAALLAVAGPALAETMPFHADLNASSEVPPNDSKGTGHLEATYDTSSKQLTWNGTYSALTGPATAAHFHGPAQPGQNAGVVVPAPAPQSPFNGSATLTDAQANDLEAGRWYFNIHTQAHPGGEIRGQVIKGK